MIFFGATISSGRVFGVLIGLGGALLIILAKTNDIINVHIEYSLLVVLATFCYAFSVNILRHKLVAVDAILITGFALMFAGIPYQDPTPAMQAEYRHHAHVASGFMKPGLVMFCLGFVLASVRRLRLSKSDGRP